MKTNKLSFDDQFPFKTVLTFRPLISFWREEAASEVPLRSEWASYVLDQIKDHPVLWSDDIDVSDIGKNDPSLDMLMTAVFPPTSWRESISAVFIPFRLRVVYSSDTFDRYRIVENFLSGTSAHGARMDYPGMLTGKAMMAYYQILSEYYGVDDDFDFPFVVESVDPDSELIRHHRISIDTRFVETRVCGELPSLSQQDLRKMLAEPMNLPLWKELLPPESFEFHGFSVVSGVDVTADESISRLKHDLLRKDALTSDERMDLLERRIRTLLGRNDIRLGVIALDRCESGQVNGARAIGRSLLLERGMPKCGNPRASVYAQTISSREPFLIDDLDLLPPQTNFERRLLDENIHNLYLAPLTSGREVIGLLELGSEEVGAVKALTAHRLSEVSSLFSTALKRSLEEQEDRVQALIKKKYTAIHPVVEWKFRRAAIDYLTQDSPDPSSEWASVSFENVIPFYGMSDIRGSSTKRTQVIQQDLAEQLGLALSVIIAASTVRPRPSLDELGFRLGKYIDDVLTGLASGDENSLLAFLQDEVEPLFDEFATYGDDVADRVRDYREEVDSALGFVYRKRKDFDVSVTRLNDALSAVLDRQEEDAQKMVPHYFQKYRTDGIDYNLYAGSSLLEEGEFSRLDLRNLRLWQLTTMAKLVRESRTLKSSLPIPLETAHLILVQSTPLSIRFRVDEKKFDVDGSYNVRYEILKKRIDKSVVVDSGERVTQPDRIAIIYSQKEEEAEYLRYLEYLREAGFFSGDVELLELEDQPGVSGLKALRVKVADEIPAVEIDVAGNNSAPDRAPFHTFDETAGTF